MISLLTHTVAFPCLAFGSLIRLALTPMHEVTVLHFNLLPLGFPVVLTARIYKTLFFPQDLRCLFCSTTCSFWFTRALCICFLPKSAICKIILGYTGVICVYHFL